MSARKGNIHAVRVGGEVHLVRAFTKAGARKRIADRIIEVELATQDELIAAHPDDIEDATVDEPDPPAPAAPNGASAPGSTGAPDAMVAAPAPTGGPFSRFLHSVGGPP